MTKGKMRFVQQEERCQAEHSFGHSEHFFFVIPSRSEESIMDASLRLRSVQHDKQCHSER